MKVSFVRPAQLPPELSIIFQLGHVIGLAGGCTDTVTGAIESTWKAFYELLAILTNKGLFVEKYFRPVSEVFFCM